MPHSVVQGKYSVITNTRENWSLATDWVEFYILLETLHKVILDTVQGITWSGTDNNSQHKNISSKEKKSLKTMINYLDTLANKIFINYPCKNLKKKLGLW